MDILAQEVIMHVKSKKIVKTQGASAQQSWLISGVLSLLTMGVTISLIHVAMLFIDPSIDFVKQVQSFWTYEEMGIQQGYLLIPLVGFAAYSQYKTDFLMSRKNESAELSVEWKKHLRTLLIIIGFVSLVIGLSQVVVLAEMVYVLAIVGVIATYNLLVSVRL